MMAFFAIMNCANKYLPEQAAKTSCTECLFVMQYRAVLVRHFLDISKDSEEWGRLKGE